MTASSSLQQQQHVDKIQRTSSHPRGSTTTQQHESSSSSSSPPTTTSTSSSSSSSLSEMSQLATQMKSLQNSNTPLTTTELDNIMTSITNVLPSSDDHGIDLTALKNLLLESCHKSHKKWDETCQSATKLSNILLPDDDKPGLSSTFRTMMDRCLTEGNWEGAAAAATSRKSCENNDGNNKPWAVLVTGVNGIRKTTSVYQDWFPRLLSQALIEPSSSSSKDDENENKNSTEEDQLPTGRNSFFRQLDHMIAILANVEFARLYELTSQSSSSSSSSSDEQQLPIDDYSRLKDAIFVRYRTLAEMMGIVLVEKARREKLNVMVETSGRDVAMFHYVDRFFPEGEYRKLALHFTIDDIGYAERSVDLRMEKEIRDGMAVLKKKSDDERNNVTDLINVNAGGPYGSDVLKGVQRDSDKVWEEEVMAGMVGDDWYKATISIRGNSKESATGVWTARAITKDGGEGEVFEFERR